MTINITSFQDALVPFTVNKLRTTQIVWLNRRAISQHAELRDAPDPGRWFQHELAYVVRDDTYFTSALVEQGATKTLFTDRYGGRGLLTNGGGARSGIVGSFQIKGIGRTPLVGQALDEWHSYGGLNLVDAALEAINSVVFGNILPHGAVQCYAVIFAGHQTAHMPSGHHNRGAGALLVRELCVRPAHFFRAGHFQVREDVREVLMDDVERTRRVNKHLCEVMNGHEGVIELIGNFLSASADQFAFARLFRIYHGAISASNISLDGRWLDLTNIGFVAVGHNFTTSADVTPFYLETSGVESIVREFLYTYSKYHHTEFDIAPLISFYQGRLNEAFVYFGLRVLGLPDVQDEGFYAYPPLHHIVDQVRTCIEADPRVCIASPVHFDPFDPVAQLLEELFTPSQVSVAPGVGWPAYLALVNRAFAHSTGYGSRRGLLLASVIRSLKQAYFCCYFSKTRLTVRLLALTKTLQLADIGHYIEASTAVGTWLFEKGASAATTIFSSAQVNVVFDGSKETFTCVRGQQPFTTSSASDCAAWIVSQDRRLFIVDDFDFLPGLTRLMERLCRIQHSMETQYAEACDIQ